MEEEEVVDVLQVKSAKSGERLHGPKADHRALSLGSFVILYGRPRASPILSSISPSSGEPCG